jgi:hypothetical protein
LHNFTAKRWKLGKWSKRHAEDYESPALTN